MHRARRNHLGLQLELPDVFRVERPRRRASVRRGLSPGHRSACRSRRQNRKCSSCPAASPRFIRSSRRFLITRSLSPSTTCRSTPNGIRLAHDQELVNKLASCGKRLEVFFQLDGFNDQISRSLRGESLTDIKLRAIEALRRGGRTHHAGVDPARRRERRSAWRFDQVRDRATLDHGHQPAAGNLFGKAFPAGTT